MTYFELLWVATLFKFLKLIKAGWSEYQVWAGLDYPLLAKFFYKKTGDLFASKGFGAFSQPGVWARMFEVSSELEWVLNSPRTIINLWFLSILEIDEPKRSLIRRAPNWLIPSNKSLVSRKCEYTVLRLIQENIVRVRC